jgi:hypothetical protein
MYVPMQMFTHSIPTASEHTITAEITETNIMLYIKMYGLNATHERQNKEYISSKRG